MPQRAQRRFLHRFAQRRMGMDGAANVFQRAPISRLCANAVDNSETLTPTACQPTIT
jgi:hypothetical protein